MGTTLDLTDFRCVFNLIWCGTFQEFIPEPLLSRLVGAFCAAIKSIIQLHCISFRNRSEGCGDIVQ